jgi:uncharacterized protein
MRRRNAISRKHAVPFTVAIAVFADPDHIVIDTLRAEDGEYRQKIVGLIQDRILTVVFVTRGEVCRLISARRSNAKEERAYGTR